MTTGLFRVGLTVMGVVQLGKIVAAEVYPLDALPSDARDAWLRIRQGSDTYGSPYFHPGFADAVAASGMPVVVVVGRDAAGTTRAVWPLHRSRGRLLPVGSPAADFQGPVAELDLDPELVIRAARARVLAVDHLVAGSAQKLESQVTTWRPSPWIDLTGGMDGYLQRASKSGRSNMSQARRRVRQAADRYGPLRVDLTSTSHTLLDRVIALKQGQYAATGARDYFGVSAHRALLHRLLDEQHVDFGGLLSAVYAGDQLIAAHFGIRSGSILHWWFPVYDPAVASLAPGWILLREIACGAPQLGITRLDLGRGEDEYKRRAMTSTDHVGTAFATRDAVTRHAIALGRSTMAGVRSSRAAPALRSLVHGARRRV